MGIFQEALSALPDYLKDATEKLRAVCDQIAKEEEEKIKKEFPDPSILPRGPNIFLSLPVKGRTTKEKAVLTLERQLGNTYAGVLYTVAARDVENLPPENIHFRKQALWEIKETVNEKILTEYAKMYKHLEGK
jgi:hypothetical protein